MSRPRKRIFAFLCRRPDSRDECKKAEKRKEVWQTQLSEDVPEPVDDEHYANNGERSGLADARGVAVTKVRFGRLRACVWVFSFLTLRSRDVLEMTWNSNFLFVRV